MRSSASSGGRGSRCCARCFRDLLAATGSTRVQLRSLFARRTGADPLAEVRARLAQVDEALFAEIAEHRLRDDLEERDDILSMLMTATFEDGTAMDDKELRDQLMTLLLAGHETTATALAWTFDLLLRHPASLGRLRHLARGRRRRLPEGDDLRVAAAASGDPARRSSPRRGPGPDASSCPPAPT